MVATRKLWGCGLAGTTYTPGIVMSGCIWCLRDVQVYVTGERFGSVKAGLVPLLQSAS